MRKLAMTTMVKNRRFLPVLGATALAIVLSSVSAFAQTDPPAYDPGALATAASTGIKTSLGGVAPVAFALMAVFIGVGLAWAWLGRAAKKK